MSKHPNAVSQRKLLDTLGVASGASARGAAATSALPWDEEQFGDAENPNVLQAVDLDPEVGWDVEYDGGGHALVDDEFVDATGVSNDGTTLTVDLGSGISFQEGDIVALQNSDVRDTSAGDTADVWVNSSTAVSTFAVQTT